ncbi:MAG: sialate O-acetylesterase [Phycisphaerales bacterium]|nr:sialate O-acetylesterase [Phycisphaerales bacterium]
MLHRLALCSLLLAASAAAQDHHDIFIVAGQSNARPQFAEGVFDEIIASGRYDNPLLFHRFHNGERMNRWVAGSTGAHWLREHFLNDFWNFLGDAELQTLTDQFDALGHTWDIAGFFWFQGEADSGSNEERNRYTSRFFHMLNSLEARFGLDHDIPFVITAIDYNGDDIWLAKMNRTPDDIEHMRQIQFSIGDDVPYGVTFDSRGWPRLDLWHVGDFFDPRGQYGPAIDIGAAEARAFLELPELAGRADLNGDGAQDLADVQLFINWFRRYDPRADLAPPADTHDLADVQAFAEAFISG